MKAGVGWAERSESHHHSPRIPVVGLADHRELAVCGLLLLAVALAFGRSLAYGFINFDDGAYVGANQHVLHGVQASQILWAFTHFHGAFWLPLVWISYMFDSQIFGGWQGGYHLTNVLLHAATATGLFLVLRRMTGGPWTGADTTGAIGWHALKGRGNERAAANDLPTPFQGVPPLPERKATLVSSTLWPAALAAALFAIHPLRVESVAWVTERKDVLNGLFFVLTLAAYTAYARRPFSLWRYLVVAACFALSLLAKPITVTVPAVLLLLDVWPLGRLQGTGAAWWRAAVRLALEKIPLAALSAIAAGVTMLGTTDATPAEPLPWLARFGHAAFSYTVFLRRLVWPVGLAMDPRAADQAPESPGAWAVAAAAVVLVALSYAAVAARRRHPYLLVGWLWYLVMLLPASGIVQQGVVLYLDRFTYLPQIGLAIALAWGAAALARRFPSYRRLGAAAAAAILAGLAATACWQTGFWKDSQTLWRRAVACHPASVPAHLYLAMALADLGQSSEAVEYCQRAIEFDPAYSVSYRRLGDIYAKIGRRSEALDSYQTAIRRQPGDGEAHCNLGDLLMELKRVPEAIAQYSEAVRLKPRDPGARNNLGEALIEAGQPDAALQHCTRAAELDPDRPAGQYNLGYCLAALGRRDEARAHLEKALRLAKVAGEKQLAQAVLRQLRRLGAVQR